jgi:hypothetical protein
MSQDLTFAIKAVNEAQGTLRSVQNDLDGVTGKADSAAAGAGRFSGALGTVGAVAGGFVAANVLAGGFEKITGAIGDSIAGYREQVQVSAQTDAVLKSTGGAAGLTADEILNLAGALKEQSLFADDAIQAGENLLLTFTGIGKDVFPEATQTMVDMSQALGQDLSSSAVQLGKALNDPINGMTALQRVGVTFTDAQKEQIRTLQESGDVAGAQRVILAELSKEFGGSAKAASDAAGAQERYKDKMDDVQDTIGQKLLPVQEKWKKAQLEVITIMLEHQEVVVAAAAVIGGVLVLAFTAWAISATAAAVATIAATAPVLAILAAIGLLAAGIVLLIKHWDDVTAAVGRFKDKVVETMISLKNEVMASQDDLKAFLLDNWQLIVTGVLAYVFPPGAGLFLIITHYREIKDALERITPEFVKVGISTVAGLLEGAASKLWDLTSWFFALPGRIVDQIPNPLSVLYSIGMSIMQGLLNGLTAGWNAVAGFVGSVAGKIASLKGPIEVDRQLLVPHGGAIMEGLGEGISKGFDVEVRPRLASITNSPRDGIPSYAPRMGGAGGGGDVHLHVHVTHPLSTAEQIANAVRPALVYLERRGGLSAGLTRPLAS